MQIPPPPRRPKVVTALIETFGFSPWLATAVALFLAGLAGLAVLWVVLSAPPRTITITSGPPGSIFERNADRYAEELTKHGITLRILPSGGSRENLQRLMAKASGVDLGFVQGGLVDGKAPPGLVSLGSVAYQPLWLFYRGTDRIRLLSELAGLRIGIGAPGSGVQPLARSLLEVNGISAAPTVFVEQDSGEAGKDFLAGKLDAIFLMGDSAPTQTVRTLLRAPEVQIYEFTQADAYVRRLPQLYLNKIVIPEGAIDFGHNLPLDDLTLIGPCVELLARKGLNSALSDLLLDVAQEVHSKPSLLARRGEFPAPLVHDFPISDDARLYYKSGKSITYDLVPSFWMANLINRLLVAIVPILLVLIPTVRLLPVLYRWSVQLRLYRCYRPLLTLERDTAGPHEPGDPEAFIRRLDVIEADVNALKVPASFASQYYDLRHHVLHVRRRIVAAMAAAER